MTPRYMECRKPGGEWSRGHRDPIFRPDLSDATLVQQWTDAYPKYEWRVTRDTTPRQVGPAILDFVEQS